MDIRPEPIELPASISRLLIETVSSKMGLGGHDPQAALDKLPASLPEGDVTRLQREFFAHNRAVHDLLRERGFR
jgi:hypothetical protein